MWICFFLQLYVIFLGTDDNIQTGYGGKSTFINDKLECNFLLLYEYLYLFIFKYEISLENEILWLYLSSTFIGVSLAHLFFLWKNYMVSNKDSTNQKSW